MGVWKIKILYLLKNMIGSLEIRIHGKHIKCVIHNMPLNHLAIHLFTEIEIELLNRIWAKLKCPIKLSEPISKKSASISAEKKENRITMHKHADHCQIQWDSNKWAKNALYSVFFSAANYLVLFTSKLTKIIDQFDNVKLERFLTALHWKIE